MLLVLSILAGSATHPSIANAATITASINGAQRFQPIDGFGVNAIPKTWEGGALRPGIDLLVAMGATLWRVDVFNGHSDWEATNDNADPFTMDQASYNTLYGGPLFADLWSELAYLNTKGATIELSMSGLVPPWMGGNAIPQAMEDEFAEEIVSLVSYARNTRGVSFHLLSPLNETNVGPPEGTTVGSSQFARMYANIAGRLDALGMSDIELVGPHTTNFDQEYTAAMMVAPALMTHVRRFAYHNYLGCCADYSAGFIASSAYPDRRLWVGEWNQCQTDGCLDSGNQPADEWVFAREMTRQLFNHVEAGASAVLAWDAWDNWHEHNPCCAVDRWGEIYKDANGIYQTKKRYYTNEQVFRFVQPGMTRIGASSGNASIRLLAFDGPGGALTIVGQNTGAATTVAGTVSGPAQPTALAFYRTTSVENAIRGPDVPLAAGRFSVDVPPDSFFTLTTAGSAPPPPADTQAPATSVTAPSAGTTVSGSAVSLAATASDNVGVTSFQFLLDGAAIGPAMTGASPYSFSWDSTTVPNGSHSVGARASDAAGNIGTATPVSITVSNAAAPPQVSAVTATGVTSTGATISWTTNVPASSQVDYGTTTTYGAATTLDPTLVTAHRVTLAGLSPGTTYHYRVRSADGAGTTVQSGDFTFVTAAAPPPAPTLLVGDRTIQTGHDSDSPGEAEAFRYTAAASGSADHLSIYLDASNTATRVVVGLYADAGGTAPGALLGQATITAAVNGAWNTAAIGPISITAGTNYWIAALPTAGTLQLRDRGTGNLSQSSAQTNLTTLPPTWSRGPNWPTSSASLYASAGP